MPYLEDSWVVEVNTGGRKIFFFYKSKVLHNTCFFASVVESLDVRENIFRFSIELIF
jgi:hypothetical protein